MICGMHCVELRPGYSSTVGMLLHSRESMQKELTRS